jgi:hypothetical protein
MREEIRTRIAHFRQMGKHDLQSYLLMASRLTAPPHEFSEEELDRIKGAVLDQMKQRLKTTPFEYLTAPDDFYFFMRQSFQHAEAHLWTETWNQTEMDSSRREKLQRVLDLWLDTPEQVEHEIRQELGDALDSYRIEGESYAIPITKILQIAKALRRSLLKHAECHGVRDCFNAMPSDPTPDECK